ncbi:MAG: DNA alkylation repair protein [Promethearchaeota archaeon]
MVSISSTKLVRERTRNFCKNIKNWTLIEDNLEILKNIADNLHKEYDLIPEKEKLGKGRLYIARHVAKEIYQYLKTEVKVDNEYIIQFIRKAFNFVENKNIQIIQHFALLFLSEYITQFSEEFENIIPLLEKAVNNEEWAIKMSCVYPIITILKKEPDKILGFLSNWSKSENENLRRLVAESLRPRAEIKWLRDPTKNDKVLEILTILNKDPSISVRKSVGNNIKDLSRYMPEKILDLMEKWIISLNIKGHDELATEVGLSREEKRLIWTIKHAMSWLKENKPEFHSRIGKILGKNYILYFDEKRNKLAKPKKKMFSI